MMKSTLLKKWLFILLTVCLIRTMTVCAAAQPDYYLTYSYTEGPEGSYVRFPVLEGGDAQICSQINEAIQSNAQFSRYLSLLSSLSPGSAGLKMDFESNCTDGKSCPSLLSLMLSAEGKMLKGRPGQIYYAMTFDLKSGEQIVFDQLCTDPAAARDHIQDLVGDIVSNDLNEYIWGDGIENVPFDSFCLDGRGNITFCYDAAAFSFISGFSGAITLCLADIEGMSGITDSALNPDAADPAVWLLGQDLQQSLDACRTPFDAAYYPGGEAWTVEKSDLRGTWLISTDGGQTVTHVLIGVFYPREAAKDINSLPADASVLPLDADTAELLLTVPGTAAVYTLHDLMYTCYYNTEGTLHSVLVQKIPE